jgi:hypothetical protein
MRARFVPSFVIPRIFAKFKACAWRAPGGKTMNRVKLSIRVPVGQEIMIRHIAKVRGMTRYQALLRVIETGLTSIMGGAATAPSTTDDDAFAALESRLSIIEALTDRSLFTASAAYAYARRAALRGDSEADKADAAMGEAAQAAYKRQRALAAEALS